MGGRPRAGQGQPIAGQPQGATALQQVEQPQSDGLQGVACDLRLRKRQMQACQGAGPAGPARAVAGRDHDGGKRCTGRAGSQDETKV